MRRCRYYGVEMVNLGMGQLHPIAVDSCKLVRKLWSSMESGIGTARGQRIRQTQKTYSSVTGVGKLTGTKSLSFVYSITHSLIYS